MVVCLFVASSWSKFSLAQQYSKEAALYTPTTCINNWRASTGQVVLWTGVSRSIIKRSWFTHQSYWRSYSYSFIDHWPHLIHPSLIMSYRITRHAQKLWFTLLTFWTIQILLYQRSDRLSNKEENIRFIGKWKYFLWLININTIYRHML